MQTGMLSNGITVLWQLSSSGMKQGYFYSKVMGVKAKLWESKMQGRIQRDRHW